MKRREDYSKHKLYETTSEEASSAFPGQEADNDLDWAKERRPQRSFFRKLLLFLGGLLLLALLIGVVYIGYLAFSISKISSNPIQLSGLASDSSGRVNILVLGVGDAGHTAERLSDSIMVISFDKHSNRVAQISVPRDLRVNIPGYGYAKINSANAYGGVSLASEVVADTLGIPIHYYVQTNFSGMKGVVDAVSGLDVNVKYRLYDSEYPCDYNQYKVCGLDIKPGLQHMDGAQALRYTRCRKGTCGNDFGRAERQQEIIRLLKDKIVRPELLLDPVRLTTVISAIGSGIKADVGVLQMLQLAYIWQEARNGVEPNSLVLSTGNDGYLRNAGGSSDLVPASGNFVEIQQKVQNIFSK